MSSSKSISVDAVGDTSCAGGGDESVGTSDALSMVVSDWVCVSGGGDAPSIAFSKPVVNSLEMGIFIINIQLTEVFACWPARAQIAKYYQVSSGAS